MRHKWDGNSHRKVCKRCGLERLKFSGQGGYRFQRQQPDGTWRGMQSMITPTCDDPFWGKAA